MSKHFRVSSRHLDKLEEVGVRASAVMERAGLPQQLLSEPRVLLTTEQFFSFWRAVKELSSDPAIGLKLGSENRPEHFDPIALTALSTKNFGEAIHQMARYKQLSCPEEVAAEMEGNEWAIQFRWLLASEPDPEALIDCCFAWVLTLARHGTGTRITPLRVEFIQQRSYGRVLERHFGCPIVFGATRNAIIFRASDAECPFVTRNADLLATLAPQLDEQLKEHRKDESFPDRVRTTIQRKLTGRRPKMQEIARELHISSRTLQRHLQDADYSFQQILEEARRQLARYYLRNSVLELTEAAYLLGYEDSSSFVRAFRTWEGVPPAHWRDTQREKAAV